MIIVNRLLGLLVGLVLIAAGVIAIIEAVVAVLDRPGWVVERGAWDAFLRELSWQHNGLQLVAAVLVLAGLALLLVQVRPGLPAALRIAEERPDREVSLEGRGLQALLRHRAAEDEDVFDASVRVRRHTAHVDLHVPPDADGAAVRGRVHDRLAEAIDGLGLDRPLRTKVDVRRSRERVR